MVLRVQFTDGSLSMNSIIEHGLPKEGEVLTFHAYSDEMKARVLEAIAKGAKLKLSVFDADGDYVTGEWFQELVT